MQLKGNIDKALEIYETCILNSQVNPTLIWILYIRFARRIDGIVLARKLFKRARDDSRITFHLFIANAYLEYFFTKVRENFKKSNIVARNLTI